MRSRAFLLIGLLFAFCDTSRQVPLFGDFSEGRTKDPAFMGTWADSGYRPSASASDFYSGVLYSQSGFYSEQRSAYASNGITTLYTTVINGDWYCHGDTLYTKYARAYVTRPLSGGSSASLAPSLGIWQTAQRYRFRGSDTLAFYTGSFSTSTGQDTVWQFSIFIRTAQ